MASSIQLSLLSGKGAPANANVSDHGENDGQYDIWDSDDDPMIIKPQPLDDDDFCMDDFKEKRPAKRIPKGRSKTGCLTCRKRKKKCDETKPKCNNCEKYAVVCEGYLEKQIWKSGKERAEEERMRVQHLQLTPLPPIFYGLETSEDMIFWKHYMEILSKVLTVEREQNNAFKDLMVPIAAKHQGLMHSILSLASKHIDFDTPYGINILRRNPNITLKALHERSIHHQDEARQKFYADVPPRGEEPTEDDVLISARYGQIICFFLEALVEGNSLGDHRLHLLAYRELILTSTPKNPAFLSFISEIFQYHIYADELIHSALAPERQTVSEGKHTHPHIDQPRLLGVTDGMLDYLSQTNAIRNEIRRNIQACIDPIVDHKSFCNAVELMNAFNEWAPHWPPGDSRELVGHLYRQMVYIHLLRTVNPPSQTATTIIMPLSQAEKLFKIVESSLALLKNLRHNDPSQRLLLLPCFIIGTASVAQEHQGAVRIAIKTIKGYTGMRNADKVMCVLEKVWQLMSAGEWLAVWDWPEVVRHMDIDFIPA